jgi:hypothetical protein
VIAIELFEVPAEADDAFVAAWRDERSGATLFRAVRDDVAPRFVSIGDPGSYELVHDDGAVDGPGGVILIAPLAETTDRFLDGWQRLRDALAPRRGYLGTRLYRSGDEFVHVARWSSPLMVYRAVRDPGFPALAEPIGFPLQPVLYQRLRVT